MAAFIDDPQGSQQFSLSVKRYIAWDTSGPEGLVVAFEHNAQAAGPQIRASFYLGDASAHSEKLLWAIHQVLIAAHWNLGDLTGFGVGVGPGRFTGVRIGLVTARTLAMVTEKPLIGFSSLKSLLWPVVSAYRASHHPLSLLEASSPKKGPSIFLTRPACKGEWFVLHGLMDPEGSSNAWLQSLKEETLSTEVFLDTLVTTLQQPERRGLPWLWLGQSKSAAFSKLSFSKDLLISQLSVAFWENLPLQASSIAHLVVQGDQAGQAQVGSDLLPTYGRVSDAEKNLFSKPS